MKIRIVKAESSSYWYADKIGEVFEVTEDGFDGGYFVRYNGEDGNYHVSTGNFEIVDENEQKTKSEAVGMANVNFDGVNYGEIETFAIKAIEALRLSAYHEGYKQGRFDEYVEGSQRFEVHGKLDVRTPQEIRDEIVAQAKHDVEDLKSEWNVRDDIPGGKMRYIRGQYVCNEEFIVNREKRTVVCLLRWKYDNSLVSKGIAKCDPSDCFNLHIGKAIVLRRALGLEIPAEYYKAPQPTEVRVGDILTWGAPGHTYVVKEGMRIFEHTHGDDDVTEFANLEKAKIIDDSCEGVTE